MFRACLIGGIVGLAMAGTAQAASDTASAGPIPVIGTVPSMCSTGAISSEDGVFALGVIVDTTTGLLLPDLATTPKTLSGSFCNSRSTISVVASRMVPESFSGPPPPGFSDAVDYTATASGWTDAPAVFDTASASNPDSTQTRTTPFAGDVQVSLSNFHTTGGDTLQLVSDPLYQGIITVTIAAAS